MTPIIYRAEPDSHSGEEDLLWVSSRYCEAVAEEIAQSPSKAWRHVDPDKKGEVCRMLERILTRPENACLMIAMERDTRIGYLLGMVKECLAELPERIGYINGLYVVKDHRRRGVGQRLLEAGQEWFRGQGLSLVELYTAIDNRSGKRFWEKNGFAPVESVMLAPL